MEITEFSERLARLRIAKGVSAREMSLSIGQSENYINKIESQQAFPSMSAFFFICEYLGITAQEFFDTGNNNPEKLNELLIVLRNLDDESLQHILGLAKALSAKK